MRATWVAIWVVASALTLLAGWAIVEAQAPPLEISLDAPATCETEPEFWFAAESVRVGWEVTGGEAPYDVLIDGELYEGSSGIVEVTCGRWRWSRLGSGPVTIQATVTDAAGRKASTLADIYALRVFSRTPRGEYWLTAGETYLIRGLLVTIPPGGGAYVERYVTGDCDTWGPACDDRFLLWRRDAGDIHASRLWIRRWSASEHSRTLVGEDFALGQLDVGTLNYSQRVASNFFDDLLSLIGNTPRTYQVTAPRSTEDGSISMTLYAPTYCLTGQSRSQREFVDVSWEVSGGREPLEVTIAGDRYLGRQGRAQVDCGFDRPGGILGGHQKVQGTVVDATGRVGSARADMYALGWAIVPEQDLPAERPYRLHNLILTTPPDLADYVEDPEGWREFFSHCWIDDDEYRRCVDAVRHSFAKDGRTAIFVLRLDSGAVVERTPRSETSAELDDLIGRLIDSIGTPPPLPEGFVESSAPLEISALLDPPVCEYQYYGGSAELYLTATGGRWWPLQVTVNGQAAGRRSTRIDCREVEASGTVVVRVSEHGAEPEQAELRLSVVARETEYEQRAYAPGNWAIKAQLPVADFCSTGQQLSLSERMDGHSTPITGWQGDDGRQRWSGVSGISCAALPGWMRLYTQIATQDGSERLVESSYVLPVRQARPERTSE